MLQAWKPRVFKPEEAACTVPAGDVSDQQDARPAKRQKREGGVQLVVADKAAVLVEMARVGAGLVQSMQVVERE